MFFPRIRCRHQPIWLPRSGKGGELYDFSSWRQGFLLFVTVRDQYDTFV